MFGCTELPNKTPWTTPWCNLYGRNQGSKRLWQNTTKSSLVIRSTVEPVHAMTGSPGTSIHWIYDTRTALGKTAETLVNCKYGFEKDVPYNFLGWHGRCQRMEGIRNHNILLLEATNILGSSSNGWRAELAAVINTIWEATLEHIQCN